MATRASVCSTLLKRFRSKNDFLLHLVTVDETWVHYMYYEPEKESAKILLFLTELVPIENEGKTENGRVDSPGSVPIHLKFMQYKSKINTNQLKFVVEFS